MSSEPMRGWRSAHWRIRSPKMAEQTGKTGVTRSLIRRFFGQERLTFVTFGCALRNNLDARIWYSLANKSSGDAGNNTRTSTKEHW